MKGSAKMNGCELPGIILRSDLNEAIMVRVCEEIGRVAEMNCHATTGMVAQIEDTGKSLEDLTIGEFLILIERHGSDYNRIHGQKL